MGCMCVLDVEGVRAVHVPVAGIAIGPLQGEPPPLWKVETSNQQLPGKWGQPGRTQTIV